MLIKLLIPICTIVIFAMWFIYGKDKKTVPVLTAYPPRDLDPLEMEFAQIATISDRGIFAEILYWVPKGYLGILTEERVGIRRISDLPDGAADHEKYLFDRLFVNGDILWFDQFPAEVSEHKSELGDKVAERFTGRDAVVENDTMIPTLGALLLLTVVIFVVEVSLGTHVFLPLFAGAVFFCSMIFLQNGALGFRSKYDRFEIAAGSIGTVAAVIGHVILLWPEGPAFAAVFAASVLICIPCIMFMERRVNNRLYGEILGFREFIKTAEWDKLKVLSEEDTNYGMEILPYAMLFNMGTEWTRRFEYKMIYTAVETMEENAREKMANR